MPLLLSFIGMVHRSGLAGYVRRITGDAETARDITQDIFVAACRVYQNQPGYSITKAWLYRAASNPAISFLRRRKRIHFIPIIDAELPAELRMEDLVVDRQTLTSALSMLPSAQRLAILLCMCYGFSSDEAAHMLDTTAQCVRQRLCRGLRALKNSAA